jgi:hypothetical protein
MHRQSGLLLFVCAGALFAAAPPEPSIPQAKAAMARLPLRFEENRGQWDASVRFTARSAGANLQLTARGPAFLVGASRVEIGLIHSNAAPAIEPLDRLPASTNYMVGARSQWHTGIANYSRVRYHGVYPGIDVVYYGNQNQLEYDFVLAPGANPDAIRLRFGGDVQVSLTPGGDLALQSGGAQVLQKAPAIYQDNRPIRGRYILLARNQVGFRLDRYDRTRPLVIDPILVYCAYMGSSGNDRISAMKMGPNGQLYITGSTPNGEMPYIDGAYDNFNDGLTDIFLAIVDTTGGNFTLKYFSYLGGSNVDVPLALEVDSAGVAYLAGDTASLDFPMAGNSFQTTFGSADRVGFVATIDPSLYGGVSLTYSTYLGGTDGSTSIAGIALDPAGFIYLIGTTAATDFPYTDNAYAQVLFGPQDAFLTKLDRNSASLPYSTYLGGGTTDEGRSIAVGTNGMVYFGITTASVDFPLEGSSYRRTLHGEDGIVIGMMDMTKSGEVSLVYSTYFGGPAPDPNVDHSGHNEEVRKIALDANNNVILTGYTLSPDFSVTPDAAQRNATGNTDVFVSVVNPSDPAHFLVYSTYFGGTQGEVAYDVKPDGAGNIYFTGYTLSPDLFTVGELYGWGGGIDVFVAAVTPGKPGIAGRLFCTYLGATGTYVGSTLEVGPDGSVYVGGYGNIGMPITGAGYSGGAADGFLVVLK